MYIKPFILLALSTLTSIAAYAQELSRKIPAASQFVVTINNKTLVENSSIELLKETLTKLGVFENVTEILEVPITDLMESDFNLNKQAYIYRTSADSLHYMGYVLPLKSDHQVSQHLFSQFTALPIHKGYERRVSTDGKTQVAWNKEALLILTGDFEDSYFQKEEVAERYGLILEQYGSDEWTYDESLAAAAADSSWWTELDELSVDSIPEDAIEAAAAADSNWWTELDELSADTLTESAIEEATAAVEAAEEAIVDTVFLDETQEYWAYEEEEYEAEEGWELEDGYYGDYGLEADSTYLMNQERNAKNDSIKNELFATWLATDFENYLDPEDNLGQQKALNLKGEKVLVRLWVPNLDKLYQEALPHSLLQMAYGFDMRNQKYGYEDATFDLIQDQHTLKLAGSVHMDKEMNKVIKALYKNKVNKKFTKYIPESHLAYASLNVSTEGYLQQLPTLISRLYAPMMGNDYADILEIATTALEIGLDEKAISKVMKGDNLFFLNDLHKVSKEYIDYEYDDNYDYTEVVKTKEEYAPNFLWMFTSEDQRIFKKALEFAVKKEKVTLENAVYTFAESNGLQPIYIFFKEDIVFVGSNIDQITAIKENRFKAARDTKTKKNIMSHPFNLVINTSAIPSVVDKLEVPVTASWKQTLHDLSAYGNLQVKSDLIKNKGFYGEVSLELPKTDKNALQYALKQLLEGLNNQDDN